MNIGVSRTELSSQSPRGIIYNKIIEVADRWIASREGVVRRKGKALWLTLPWIGTVLSQRPLSHL